MKLITMLVGVLIIFAVIVSILFVLFGQVTVRKLRKNPQTKDHLGVQFVGGWDIINVAQALAIPRSWSRKLEKSPLSSMYANSDLLFENTSKFDRILGTIFYWLLMSSGLSGVLLVFLDYFGIFE